jgi:glycosyltransferase involved in cell wall biosynthesis
MTQRLALLVPARNAESVIGRLFDSAGAQYTPFDEVHVYDDASTDRTGEIARLRGAQVVRSDVNTGPSAGKNQLAAVTTCEWIHFHDADDAMHPEFVTRARTWMRADDADVVLFATEDREEGTDRVLARRAWDDAALAIDALRYAIPRTITNCGIYRREAFLAAGGFNLDPAVKYNEDQAMHAQLALHGLRFRADNLPAMVIYQRAHSMSSGHRVECARAQVDVLDWIAARTRQTYLTEIGQSLWRLAGVCAGYSDWTYVRRCLDIAARLGYDHPHREHWVVQALARLSPFAAVAARETVIRAVKPHLREDMPSVAANR